MSIANSESPAEANQRGLLCALASVRRALERQQFQAQEEEPISTNQSPPGHETKNQDAELKQTAIGSGAGEDLVRSAALDLICTSFGLSPFERDVLLLCAGMELDSAFGPLCAAANGNPGRTYPTWGLALALFPGAHWNALPPTAPLRRWHLVEIASGPDLTNSALRIDERVLHFLAGASHPDERLAGIIEPVKSTYRLMPAQKKMAAEIAGTWSASDWPDGLPFLQLFGNETSGKLAVAAAASAALGLNLNLVSAQILPLNPVELESLARLLEREAALTASALFLDCNDLDCSDKARVQAVTRLIESLRSTLFVSSVTRWNLGRRPRLHFEIRCPDVAEQRNAWENALGDNASILNGHLDEIVAHFNLTPEGIGSACDIAIAKTVGVTSSPGEELAARLWNACRTITRPRLEDLAQRIEPTAAWDDLVLPDPQMLLLRQIAMQVHQRARVYEAWGFGEKCARGLGISALFAGPSGTGKTMAAEVLANELRLDLYRIDLSQVVNKYIGETEKNLRRVFDAAEAGGAILLFDEADALFGKRSEVKDSHDRFSNIEVSYLLQRMEAYRGLAILTSNLKNALDTAFQRRIRFVVHFPYPDTADRTRIWQRIFPSQTPVENLDMNRLARLNVAGGNIRNIALNAAFLAADAEEPVRMKHLRCAAQSEYTKMEKPLSDAEIGGWV